jgi:hypothetical protein
MICLFERGVADLSSTPELPNNRNMLYEMSINAVLEAAYGEEAGRVQHILQKIAVANRAAERRTFSRDDVLEVLQHAHEREFWESLCVRR